MRLGNAVVVVFLVLAGPATSAQTPVEPTLPVLLERLDRVAGLYRSGALDFTCVEKIRVNGRRHGKYDYIYKVSDAELEDRHISRALGRGSELQRTPEGVPDGIARPSLWTGLFFEARQPYMRYTIAGRAVALGRPALRVSFEPAPGEPIMREVNDWTGTAWIDAESFQVIQVVARDAADLARYRKMLERHEPKPFTFEITTYSSWFGHVKNGMRFPSEVRTERKRYLVPDEDIDDPDAGYRVFFVVQSFDKYRFYNVRSHEQVTRIVFGKEVEDR